MRLMEREPKEFVLGFGVQRLGEVSQNEHRQHPVMPIVVGGVEELCRLANAVAQADATSEFFPDLTGERVLGGFFRQGAAARKPQTARRAPYDSDRPAFTKEDAVCRTPLRVERACFTDTEGRSLR